MNILMETKRRNKGLTIFQRFLIVYIGIGIGIVAAISAAYYIHAQGTIQEELKRQVGSILSVSAENFKNTYISPVRKDLEFIDASLFLNNYLNAEENEKYVVKSVAERMLLQFTRSAESVYLSARFIDARGEEKIVVAGNRRERNYVSAASHPGDVFYSKEFALFQRLRAYKEGSILIEGPFRHNGAVTFLAGIAKQEPEVGGFAGAVIFHCDLKPFLMELEQFRLYNEPVVHLFNKYNGLISGGGPADVPDFYRISETIRMGDDNKELFTITAGIPGHIFKDMLWDAVKNMLIFMLILLVIGVFVAARVTTYLSKPLLHLVSVVNRIADGDLTVRATRSTSGEVGELMDRFNEMTECLQATTVSRDVLSVEVAERKKAEEAVAGQNRFLQSVLKSIGNPLYVIDVEDYSIVLANVAARRSWAQQEGTCYQLTHHREKPCLGDHRCPLAEVKKTKEPVTVEHVHYDETGRTRIVEVHGYPILDINGNVVQMIEYCQDITDRKKAEAALLESQERYRTLVDSMSMGVALIDKEMRVVSMNKQMREWFPGVDPAVLPVCYRVFNNPPCNETCSYCPTCKTLKDGNRHEAITETPVNGLIVNYRVVSSALKDASGAIVGAIEIVEDVTERRKAEEMIRSYTRHIETINKELDDFTYIISHDLKEPLRSINAFSKFVLEDCGDKIGGEGKLYLERIRANAGRMQRLIDDLLELSRIERRKNTFENVEAVKIIGDIKERLEYSIAEKKVEFVVKGPLPIVTADKVRLGEVFLNLVSNAIKYNDKPQPVIEIGCSSGDEAHEFYVKDNGPGIEEKYFEKIFEIFQRLNKREDYEGTGAGLTIARKVVQMHGGRIWVESKVGEGTTFRFTIPRKPAIVIRGPDSSESTIMNANQA